MIRRADAIDHAVACSVARGAESWTEAVLGDVPAGG